MRKLRCFLSLIVLVIMISLNNNLIYASSTSNSNGNDISSSTFVKDIAYGKGKYVIVGQNGLIQTSTDKINWKDINSNTKNTICKIIFVNDNFIAVGEKGMILTSEDGESWSKSTINNKVDFLSIGYSGAQYIIVDNRHKIYVSKNLDSWEKIELGLKEGALLPESTFKIAQNGKKIVIVDGGAILTSEDGLNWKRIECDYGSSLGVAYVKDRFIVNTLWSKIITSKDGVNWKEFDDEDEKDLDVKTYSGWITKTKVISNKDTCISILQSPSGGNKIKFYNYINDKIFQFTKPGVLSISEPSSEDSIKWGDVKLSIYDKNDIIENNENKIPDAKEFKEISIKDKNRVFHVKFTQDVDLSDCKDYVVVARDGLGKHPVPGISISAGKQKNIIDINPPKDGFEKGCYYVVVKSGLNSNENKDQKIKRICRMKFTVKEDTVEQNTMYNVIKNSLLAVDEKANVKNCIDFDHEKIIDVIVQVVKDNPLILYYDDARINENGEIMWQYRKDRKRCIEDMEKVKKKTDAIIQELIKPEMDEYEKEKAVHDYIISHCDYDDKKVGLDEEIHSAYGVLINGLGVCDGYAEAMQYVMQELSIDCRKVIGHGSGRAHAWNVIKINGNWYQLDVTFDDYGDKARHKYFNITDEEMRIDHTYINNYPSCTSKEDNYYNREDSVDEWEFF